MALTGNTFFFPWEPALMEWLQTNLSSGLISFISHLSFFGEEIFLVLVIGFLYWSWNKELGTKAGIHVLMCLAWFPIAKNVALRRRPYMDHESIQILRVVEPSADPMDITAQGYSFPSGHSACSMSLFGTIARFTKKGWLIALAVLIPLLVGFSRVAVGAHYPTDVLGGWLVALFVIAFVPWLEKKLKKRELFYGVLILLALPGMFICKSTDYFTGFGLLTGFLAATLLDAKVIHFENTRSPLRAILRVVIGAGLFLGLNTLLKLPFSKDFLNSGVPASLLVRSVRYAVVTFLVFGVYPYFFRFTARIGAKKTPNVAAAQ